MKHILLAAGFAFAISAASPVVAQNHCDAKYDPAAVAVSPPPAGTPPNIAAFSGVWGPAKWDGVLCHVLVVQKVEADGTAEYRYIHGVWVAWNAHTADSFAGKGQIKGDTLSFTSPRGGLTLSYKMQGGGTSLDGTFGRSKIALPKAAN